MDKYWKQKEATSRFVVGQLLLTDAVLRLVRRQVRLLSGGVKVTPDHLAELIRNEVIKRDVLEGERAASATKIVKRLGRRRTKAAGPELVPAATDQPNPITP
jgi:hypothetical protein